MNKSKPTAEAQRRRDNAEEMTWLLLKFSANPLRLCASAVDLYVL
jgi:hypothetical protein